MRPAGLLVEACNASFTELASEGLPSQPKKSAARAKSGVALEMTIFARRRSDDGSPPINLPSNFGSKSTYISFHQAGVSAASFIPAVSTMLISGLSIASMVSTLIFPAFSATACIVFCISNTRTSTLSIEKPLCELKST